MSTTVQTAEAWLALPEITFPVLASQATSGARFTVRKIGFLAVDEVDCERAGIEVKPGPAGKRLLPTSVVEFSSSATLCRLPLELSTWAFEAVNAAHAGFLRLPTTVEFGEIAGRKYAEFV